MHSLQDGAFVFMQHRLLSPHIIQVQVKKLFLDLNYSLLLNNAFLNLEFFIVSFFIYKHLPNLKAFLSRVCAQLCYSGASCCIFYAVASPYPSCYI